MSQNQKQRRRRHTLDLRGMCERFGTLAIQLSRKLVRQSRHREVVEITAQNEGLVPTQGLYVGLLSFFILRIQGLTCNLRKDIVVKLWKTRSGPQDLQRHVGIPKQRQCRPP